MDYCGCRNKKCHAKPKTGTTTGHVHAIIYWNSRVARSIERGICAVCGCTDDHACEEGCRWVNADNTLCSACAQKLGILELFDDSKKHDDESPGPFPEAVEGDF